MPSAKCSRRQDPKGENSWHTMVELLACSCFFLFHFSLLVDLLFHKAVPFFKARKPLFKANHSGGQTPLIPCRVEPSSFKTPKGGLI